MLVFISTTLRFTANLMKKVVIPFSQPMPWVLEAIFSMVNSTLRTSKPINQEPWFASTLRWVSLFHLSFSLCLKIVKETSEPVLFRPRLWIYQLFQYILITYQNICQRLLFQNCVSIVMNHHTVGFERSTNMGILLWKINYFCL